MKNEEKENEFLDSSFELRTSNFRRLYAVVLIELAVTIAIFYAFTKAFQ
jgi:hypothetical protein